MKTDFIARQSTAAIMRPPRKTDGTVTGSLAGVPLFLQNTFIQREESTSLPPLTLPQLTPPSLLGPKQPGAGLLGNTPQLTLDPQIQLSMIEMLFAKRLDPVVLNAALRGALQAPAPQKPASTAGTSPLPTPQPPASGATPAKPTPSTAPVPNPFPEPPRPGEAGDIIDAATSAAAPVLEPMKAQLFSQLKQGWGSFSTVEKIGVVSFGIGTVSLAGVGAFGNPNARSFIFDKLNGVVIPVPEAGWLGLETHILGDHLFFGAHLDVGQLLPEAVGFGPADFNSISDPKPDYVPQRRVNLTDSLHLSDDAGARIAAAQSGGNPLPLAARAQIESGLGADLSQVRVHTDPQADSLAHDLAANAFTTGAHIFMRAGQYRPDTQGGLRLLAHEAAHTVQQASGPVNGVPVGGGIALSQAGDPHERAADQAAERVMRGIPATNDAGAPVVKPAAPGAIIQREELLTAHEPAAADSAVDDTLVWWYINTALENNGGGVWEASIDLTEARRAPGFELDPNLAAAEHYMFARVLSKGAPTYVVAALAINYGLGKELLKDFGIDPSFTDQPTTESSTDQINYGIAGAMEESWLGKLYDEYF